MHLCIALRWGCLRIQARFIGKSRHHLKVTIHANYFRRFKDIGYNHVPYFNCPSSPKCKGCKAGQFYAGEPWLQKEDCRPNWFKYVGTG